MKTYAIILSGGTGQRTGLDVHKQFIKIAGKTIIEHTIDVFEKHTQVDEIFIITHVSNRKQLESFILKNDYRKITKILNGGNSRRESSSIGVNAIKENDSVVLIHDAVRPFLSPVIIDSCLEALKKHEAIDVAIPSSDTIINVGQSGMIHSIPTRSSMLRGQTPQGFKAGVIKKAHALAAQEKEISVTDDCGLIVKYGLSDVFVVQGEEKNIKITYPLDIYIADKLFQLNNMELSKHNPLKKLQGMVGIVFGGTKGIGKSIVSMANAHGAKVYGVSRRTGTDVCSETEVKRTLKKVYSEESRIDFVINTAGILNMGKLSARNMDAIREEIDINYFGAINVLKHSIPYLQESRGSALLFTSSSYTRGRALYSIYSSTKAAVVNLVQATAEELLDDGIRINAINPERTSTPMRWNNFGKEPDHTLLSPDSVAEKSLHTILSDVTGEIVSVRRDDV